MIALSSYALNSPKNLLLSDGSISWSSDVSDAWIIGGGRVPRSVEALFETLGRDPPRVIPEEFERSMEDLARGQVPWPLVIPKKILSEHLISIAGDIDDSIESLGDYAETLASSRKIISQLRPCRIDLAALRVEQGRATTSVLDSFEPGPDSMVAPPLYSHATATGRLTVRSGPRILTLQKEHRRILASRFDGGRMMQIDFVSLEPRVLRLIADGSAPIDIYSDVSTRLGGAVDRRQVKLATLKMLYGSGRAGIVDDIGSISQKAIKEIENYFGLPQLRMRLQAELAREGMIRNLWGRPLPEANETHLLVSHFAQSTAVDVALGGFGDMLSHILDEDLDVVPCYILHDALLIDVHPDAEPRLRAIVSDGVDIEELGHFEVSLSPAYIEEEGK